MKLATWNVALPVSERRRTAARAEIDKIEADVLVLTEAHDGFDPGFRKSHSSAAGRDDNYPSPHRWVTIWSNFELTPIATSDVNRTAAARVFPKDGDPFLVYGTVLPWVGSKWHDYPSAGGIAFTEALKVQVADWHRMRHKYPDDELFVLGDFNQDLVHPRYYGSKTNRAALVAALNECGLVAITEGDGDPIRRDLKDFACIDHICALSGSRWKPEKTERWPNVAKPEKWLSDHFGVAVSFVFN